MGDLVAFLTWCIFGLLHCEGIVFIVSSHTLISAAGEEVAICKYVNCKGCAVLKDMLLQIIEFSLVQSSY